MDNGGVPLRRRTRLQHDLFYKKYFEEKKKVNERESGGSGSGGGSVSESSEKSDFNGVRVDVDFVGSESSGTNKGVKGAKSSKGLTKNEKKVGINEDSRKIKKKKKIERGVEINKDVVFPTGMGQRELGGKLKKGKSVGGKGVVCGSKDNESDDDDDIMYLCEFDDNNDVTYLGECDDNEYSQEFESCKKDNDECLHDLESPKEDLDEYSHELQSSSEEDNDDPDDTDFVVVISSSSGEDEDEESEEEKEDDDENEVCEEEVEEVEEERKSDEEDGGGEEKTEEEKSALKGKSCDGKERERNIEGGLKRKRVFGLDILVDCENGPNVEHGGPATRLRSSRSASKAGKKKLKFGGVSRPVPVEEYEELDSSSSESESDGVNDDYHKNYVQKVHEKGIGKVKVSNGKKHTHRGKDFDVIKILTNSIREDGDKVLENFARLQEENHVREKVLSYKFDFEDEEDKAREKEEWEIEVDGLFSEMYMSLQLEEIGSSNGFVADNDDEIEVLEKELDQAILCRRGKHQLILNDQFGIMCRFCPHVEMEMKDILPPLSKNSFGERDRCDFGKAESMNLFDLHFHDSGFESRYGSEGCIHEKGTVWDLIPGVRETMYPHQHGGFEFIWKNIAGGTRIEKLKKPLPAGGCGCIISHAPGTGKSRLTIVFLQSFLKMYPSCRPLIIAPRSMLLTWEEEFKKWNVDIPFHILNKQELSGQEDKTATNLLKQDGRKRRDLRLLKLYSWKKETSILGITYRLFEELAGEEGRRKKNPEDEAIKKTLLGIPSLVVLDEGHTPRNDNSLIWKALSNVETQRRIILSGTPFQNNFDELYNTLYLVNPRFVEGIIPRSCNDYGRKCLRRSNKARGQWASLTSSIGKKSNVKLNELRAMIDPFVHVHKGTILRERLPGLRDALVVLKPTKTQQSLLQRMKGQKNTLVENHLMSLISVHPSLLLENLSEQPGFKSHRDVLEKIKRKPSAGVKTKFLMELIRLSEALNEKVLVFSQFIIPLKFVMKLLKTHFGWVKDRDFLYMDGKQEEKLRQSSINSFNDPNSQVKVLLASIRACSEGISLVGASRVVLLDVHWNPSVERQAISRAYRLGQKKLVHIYHLVTGTMEGEKYIKQVEKSRLSELVFSSKDINGHKPEISSTVSEDKILEGLVQHEKLRDMFEKVIYQPKESDLVQTFGLVDNGNADFV